MEFHARFNCSLSVEKLLFLCFHREEWSESFFPSYSSSNAQRLLQIALINPSAIVSDVETWNFQKLVVFFFCIRFLLLIILRVVWLDCYSIDLPFIIATMLLFDYDWNSDRFNTNRHIDTHAHPIQPGQTIIFKHITRVECASKRWRNKKNEETCTRSK